MSKIHIALHLKSLSVDELRSLARLVHSKMKGNNVFPAPDVSLAEVAKQTDALDAAALATKKAHNDWLAHASAQAAAESQLGETLGVLGRYVERVSKNETEAASSGFSLAQAPVHHHGAHPAPTGLAATTGDQPGEADLVWDAQHPKPTGYHVQWGEGESGPFNAGTPVTKSRATIDGLPSGKRVFFRVSAFGPNGDGAFSPSVSCMIP